MCEVTASVLSQEHELIAIVGDGNEVLPAAERLSPEVIILDISMPGRSGLQILSELRIRMPFVVIVILTAHTEPIYVEAIRRGARIRSEEQFDERPAPHHLHCHLDATRTASTGQAIRTLAA